MPTKLNKAGKQQPYIPEGNGDASGEYADGQGYNRNKPSQEKGSGSSVGSTSSVNKGGNSGKEPQNQPPQPQITKNVPTPKEREKLGGMGIITDDMKTAEFTQNFAPDVKITRGSLNKDEIGEFNAYLQNIFNEYPDMQKFRKISVRNNEKSSTGGYIMTSTNYFTGEKNYELYINSGWLEDRQAISDERTLKWYRTQVEYMENELITITDDSKKGNLEHMLNSFKESINKIEERRKSPKTEFSNVVNRCSTRSERLKSLMAHELMYRITQEFDYAVSNKKITTEELKQKHSDLTKKIRDVYNEAIKNGDAKKISRYATTSRDEFLSEANSMLEGGYEMPKYITEVLEELKDFNKKVNI